MRWVFYALLIINLAYGGWKITFWIMQPPANSVAEVSLEQPLKAPMTLQVVSGGIQPTAAPVVSAASALCTSLGPWQDAASASQAKTELGELAQQAGVVSVAVQKQGLSWVYLPAYPSRDAALKVLKELQRQGVDSFITDDGEQANAISLGFFGSRDSALGLQQRIQQAGFDAQVRETAHGITEYWLNLGAVKADALAPWLEQHPDLTLGRVACQAAVTPNLINLPSPAK